MRAMMGVRKRFIGAFATEEDWEIMVTCAQPSIIGE